MRKFVIFAAFFFAGLFFGDAVLRGLDVVWSDVVQTIQPTVEGLKDQMNQYNSPENY